jgi:hypothetical protein
MERLLSQEMMPITLTGLGLISVLILALIGLVVSRSRTPDVSQRLSEFAGRADPKQGEPAARQALDRID